MENPAILRGRNKSHKMPASRCKDPLTCAQVFVKHDFCSLGQDDRYCSFLARKLLKQENLEPGASLLEVYTEPNSMAGVRSLVGLGLAGTAGMSLLILACTLHQQNWWPAVVTIFYFLVPLPILISRPLSDQSGFSGQTNPAKEWAYFITTGIVISALALPIILCRVDTIETAATVLSLTSSVFFFSTILAFFVVFQSEDDYIGGAF